MQQETLSLFNADNLTHHLNAWEHRDGRKPEWRVEEGYVEISPGSGDLLTKELFGSFHLDIEFWLPKMRHKQGQDRANSGIFLHGLYEIQILDSYENSTYPEGACGALYAIMPPLKNASLPPERWQSMEIDFYAPHGKRLGEVTVNLNGVTVLDRVPIYKPTGGGLSTGRLPEHGPLLLQDHGSPVRFRNLTITQYQEAIPLAS